MRFDWAESPKSQWFLRTSQDSYLTHNALVQQGTLPSTGLTTHNNYWNTAISNTYTFSPTWLGNLVLDASLLHLTQTRNSDLGFALAFPFSSTALTFPVSKLSATTSSPLRLLFSPTCAIRRNISSATT